MLTLKLSGFNALEAMELMQTGLEIRRQRTQAQIAELTLLLGSVNPSKSGSAALPAAKPANPPAKPAPGKSKRPPLSAESIENIRAAQKKRWAAHHRENKTAAPRASRKKAAPEPEAMAGD